MERLFPTMGLMCCRNSRTLNLSTFSKRTTANIVAKEPSGEMQESRNSMDLQWQTLAVPENKETNNEILHAKALNLWQSERCHEAFSMYDRLYEIELSSLGKRHVRTITTNENRAHLMHTVGRHEEALEIFDDVIITRTEVLGREHKDTISAKLGKAVLLEKMTRQSEALLAFEEALDCARKCDSIQQTEVALRGRARILFEMSRYSEALQATHEVLRFLDSSEFPYTQQDTLTLRRNEAQCLQFLGHRDEAIHTYRQVLRLQEDTLGAEHQDTLSTAHSLAVLLDMSGEKEEASQIYEALLRSWRTQVTHLSGSLGELHPFTLQAKNNLSSVLQSSTVGSNISEERNTDDFNY